MEPNINQNKSKFKIKFKINKKILTFLLLLISLIFGGIAIFLAITINNRNVNPDDTAASDPCGGKCPGGHYCDSSTCKNPPYAFCCPNGSSCACPIPQNTGGGGGGGGKPDPCGGCPAQHYCDSTTCRGRAFCCPNNTSCATDAYRQRYCPAQVGCKIVEEGLMCGAAAGCDSPDKGKSIRFEVCPDGSKRDISDKECVVKNPGCTGGVINNCDRNAINPSCGSGNAQEGEVCPCQSNNPVDRFTGGQQCVRNGNVLSWSICSRDYRPNQPVQNCDKGNGQKAILGEARECTSTGTDQFVGRQICTISGWSECARADGTQPGANGCPRGMNIVSGVCVSPCDGTKHICGCGNNLCSGNYGQKFICGGNNECRIADSSAWAGGGNCRVRTDSTGSVGNCAPAEFASCNPPVGQMCWCGGLGGVINQGNGVYYRYGTTEYRSVGECGSTCNDKAIGGIYVAASCGNPYKCPNSTVGDRIPTPVGKRCDPISYCNPVDSKRYTIKCNADGTYAPPIIEDDPTCRSSCPRSRFCRGCDLVTIDCHGNELSVERDHPDCPCNSNKSIGYCASMSIDIAGRSLRVDTNTPRGGNVIVIPNEEIPWGRQINISTELGGKNDLYRPSVFWMRPYIEDINDPINTFGTHNHGCSFYILGQNKPPRFLTATLPNDPNRVIRNDDYNKWNNARCEDYPVNYNDPKVKGIIFGVNYSLNGDWVGDWCRNIGPNTTDGILFNVGVPKFTPCTNPCVIRTASAPPTTPPVNTPSSTPTPTPPEPVCQSIQITNTRNNAQCSSQNPQGCDVRPGDTLNVNLSGSNVENYRVTGSVTAWRSGLAPQNQPQIQVTQLPNSNSAFSVVVPAVPDMLSFTIQGAAIARNITSEPEVCRLTFNFNDNPDLSKQINRNGSTPQIPQNQNPVIVTAGNIVEYDVTISNNGTSILGNVIVYDRLINIDNGVPNTSAPIGVIVSASNLSRTTGNNSNPNPVPLEGGFSTNTVPPNSTLIPHSNNTFNASNNVIQVRWNRIQAFYPGEVYSGKVRAQINNFQNYPGLRNEVCIIVDSNQNNQPDVGEIHICRQVDVFTQQPNFIVSKTVNNDSPSLNDTITYTITLRNTSDNNLDLSRVTITDIMSSEYANRLTITPSNNGSVQGNTIVWNSSSLIQANGNNSSLAPGGEISLTVQVRFNNNFFNIDNSGNMICVLSINNEVRASSNSPDFNATSNTVNVNVNNPACLATPTSTSTSTSTSTGGAPITRLPPTGIDIRNNLIWIISIISVGIVASYIVLSRNNMYILKFIKEKTLAQIKYIKEPKIKKIFTKKKKKIK